MDIQNVPEIFLTDSKTETDLFIYDFKMTDDVIKSKVNLDLNMFSFLQTGKKQVHFSDTSVGVNASQSLLIKNGNCLWTELLDNDEIYFCKLLFFSQKKVEEFLKKHSSKNHNTKQSQRKEAPFFIIQNDDYIHAFVNSLSSILKLNQASTKSLLALKFEEIMLYLFNKYGDMFLEYLHSLITIKDNSSFKKIIEANAYSNLKLEEIAFLCNMSLSTFKRHFKAEYNQTPAKWMQKKRLKRAKKLLQTKGYKPSDVYLDLGYNNLSNFSIAFKNEFGISPKEVNFIKK